MVQNIIWYSNPFILLACAFGLHVRRLRRRFPFFFAYLLFVAIASSLTHSFEILSGFHSWAYFIGYWMSEGLARVIGLIVLYEVLRNVLTSGTIDIKRSSLVWAISVLALASLAVALKLGHKSTDPVMNAIWVGVDASRFLRIGIFCLFAALTLFFRLYWGELAFGIVAGYGVISIMESADAYLLSRLGETSSHVFNLVNSWTFQASSCIWLFYILKKPKLPPLVLPSDKVSEYTEPIDRLIK